MPVIIVKARAGVLATKEKKAELIELLAASFAKVVGDETYNSRTTVVIEEVPNENWGRAGKQVSPTG